MLSSSLCKSVWNIGKLNLSKTLNFIKKYKKVKIKENDYPEKTFSMDYRTRGVGPDTDTEKGRRRNVDWGTAAHSATRGLPYNLVNKALKMKTDCYH